MHTHTCCYISTHAAIYQLMLLYINSCCYISTHAAIYPHMLLYTHACCYNNNNKRPLTPKSMPPAGDEHMLLYIRTCCCIPTHAAVNGTSGMICCTQFTHTQSGLYLCPPLTRTPPRAHTHTHTHACTYAHPHPHPRTHACTHACTHRQPLPMLLPPHTAHTQVTSPYGPQFVPSKCTTNLATNTTTCPPLYADGSEPDWTGQLPFTASGTSGDTANAAFVEFRKAVCRWVDTATATACRHSGARQVWVLTLELYTMAFLHLINICN